MRSSVTWGRISSSARTITAVGSLDDPDIAEPSEQFGTEAISAHWHKLTDLPGKTTEDSMPADWLEKIARG